MRTIFSIEAQSGVKLLSLDYAAVLHAIGQITLARGAPVDAWDVVAWYCRRRSVSVTKIYDTLEQAWFDATGEQLTA